MNIGGDTLSIAASQFGLRLLSRLVARSPGRNVIVSPMGLFQALSLYAFLADEETRREMRKALNIADLRDDALRGMYHRLSAALSVQDADTELSCAMALWMGSAVKLDEAFAALAQEWGVAVFSGSEVTPERMREWAQKQTRGLFSPSGGSVSPLGANLMNALYMRGTWASPFRTENTKPRLFYRDGGLPKLLPLMRQAETRAVRLYHGNGFDAASIPYSSSAGRELSLQVILPHHTAVGTVTGKDTLTPFVGGFSLGDWDRCQNGFSEALVDLILPRFTFRQTHDLDSVLLQMGMGKSFKTANARMNPFVPAIEKVLQQVYMEVDEQGTTAASLTEIVMVGASAMPRPRPRVEKFHVNHPFLFFLAEETSGLLLFAGVIHNPEES